MFNTDQQPQPGRPLRVGDRVAFIHNDLPDEGKILAIHMEHNADPLLEISNGRRSFVRLASEVQHLRSDD